MCYIICSRGWFSRKHLLTVAVYFVYKKWLEHFPIFFSADNFKVICTFGTDPDCYQHMSIFCLFFKVYYISIKYAYVYIHIRKWIMYLCV